MGFISHIAGVFGEKIINATIRPKPISSSIPAVLEKHLPPVVEHRDIRTKTHRGKTFYINPSPPVIAPKPDPIAESMPVIKTVLVVGAIGVIISLL